MKINTMKKLITILLVLFSITAFGQYRYTMAVGEYAISSLGSTTYVTNNTRVVNWPTPIDRATAYKYVTSGANLDTLTTTRTKPGFLYVGLEPGGTFTGTLIVADDSVKVGPGAVANVRSGKSGVNPVISGYSPNGKTDFEFSNITIETVPLIATDELFLLMEDGKYLLVTN